MNYYESHKKQIKIIVLVFAVVLCAMAWYFFEEKKIHMPYALIIGVVIIISVLVDLIGFVYTKVKSNERRNQIKRILLGVTTIVAGAIFAQVKTYYFGNNQHPQSWQEVICDWIPVVLYYIGISYLCSVKMLGRKASAVKPVACSSTKHNSQCLLNAYDDEPVFVLRAKDITAPDIVQKWVTMNTGIQPHEKRGRALDLSKEMEQWREKNKHRWETKPNS